MILHLFFMDDLTQAYSHVVSNTVYEKTAQTLDGAHVDIANKNAEI